MPITLPIGPGVTIKVGDNEYKLTDHNRSELGVSPSRIEHRKRMADGTMRSFIVATKRKFKLSWEDLPRENNQTVEGNWGAASIINFWETHLGEFQIILTDGNNDTETVTVMFDSFSYKRNTRSVYTDLYDIDMDLEEV
jgi:hypothetical protein